MQSRNSKLILCPFCFFDKIDNPLLAELLLSFVCPFCSNFAKQILSRPTHNSAFPVLSQYIINSFTYVLTRSHPEVYTRYYNYNYGSITPGDPAMAKSLVGLVSMHYMYFAFIMPFKPLQNMTIFMLNKMK